jgi:hypothetical protein
MMLACMEHFFHLKQFISTSNVNDIETKRNEAKRSFDLGIFLIFKRNESGLFQKL